MNNFYGDNTRWFVGDVKSVSDPLELGRIQVRVHGIHSDNQIDIPDANLPWAQTVVPITEGGTKGIGNNLGIKVGALVFGIFLDGMDSQLPLVLGSMPKYEEGSPGGLSTNQLARGTNTLADLKVAAGTDPDIVTDEPASPYAAVYPKNNVYASESGHVIELDDTPDAERIHIYHKSGTFVEMHPNGDVVTHMKNGFKTVTGNDKIHVTGTMDMVIDGDMNINVVGDVAMNGATINLNRGTQGAARIGDTADVGDDPPGISGSDGSNVIETGSQTVFIGD